MFVSLPVISVCLCVFVSKSVHALVCLGVGVRARLCVYICVCVRVRVSIFISGHKRIICQYRLKAKHRKRQQKNECIDGMA